MHSRISTLGSFCLGAIGAGAVIFLGGCVSTVRSTLAASNEPTSSLYAQAASAARAAMVHESSTLSFALDRIDQHGLPLDRTYRHHASGKGVTVYVFDGGIAANHPELAGRVREGFAGFPGDLKICNPHGTAVAGAIAGTTLGVAPEAEIVDVKMVQCEKVRGTIKAIVDGAHWVIADHRAHPGPAVANWSFIADTSARIAALDSAVAALRAAGISVIVSAGNFDIDACHVSPGNAPGVIVVGASGVETEVDSSGTSKTIDRRSPDTAYGPCIDIYAPGDSVLLPSLDRDDTPISQLWNGTSMSAGYVSGAAALYLETHPKATPDQVANALESVATVTPMRGTKTAAARMLYVGTPQPTLLAQNR